MATFEECGYRIGRGLAEPNAVEQSQRRRWDKDGLIEMIQAGENVQKRIASEHKRTINGSIGGRLGLGRRRRLPLAITLARMNRSLPGSSLLRSRWLAPAARRLLLGGLDARQLHRTTPARRESQEEGVGQHQKFEEVSDHHPYSTHGRGEFQGTIGASSTEVVLCDTSIDGKGATHEVSGMGRTKFRLLRARLLLHQSSCDKA